MRATTQPWRREEKSATPCSLSGPASFHKRSLKRKQNQEPTKEGGSTQLLDVSGRGPSIPGAAFNDAPSRQLSKTRASEKPVV